MTTVVFTGIDGSTIKVTSALLFTRDGYTSQAVVEFDSQQQEFAAGRLELGQLVAKANGIVFDEEYSLQNGTLRLGHTAQYDPQSGLFYSVNLGVWFGQVHSLETVSHSGGTSDLISLFSRIRIFESDTGLWIRPTDAGVQLQHAGQHAPVVRVRIQRLGLLDVFELTSDKASQVPAWPGEAVPGGNLYVANANDPERLYLVLVGSTTLTRIDPEESFVETDFVAAAADLTVDWAPG